MAERLFDDSDVPERAAAAPPEPASEGKPRLRLPQRNQVEFFEAALDELLTPDHEARLIWLAVSKLDLSPWLQDIKAVEGRVGRDATDPRMLLALWIYATVDGEGSARRIARLCQDHVAYRWLCGGVSLNYHTLADFRSQGGEKWDELFTEVLAGLMAEDLVTLKCIAQDGMRVRANAGKASFRRKPTLENCRVEAKMQIETLRQLAEENPEELNRRQQAARERAARERAERVEAALEHCQELQTQREQRAKTSCEPAKEARASTTDPEARNMKFANGGYDPGFNVQFATDTDNGLVVGVDVTNAGSDSEELPPMLDQIHTRCGRDPEKATVDGGFGTKEAITDAAENHNCTVFAPLKDLAKQQAKGVDPHVPKKGDSPQVAAWRERMGTAAAKAIYKLRAQTAEWVNAQCRNRGLRQMPVRGVAKCRIVALLYAVTHNLLHAEHLRAKAAQPA